MTWYSQLVVKDGMYYWLVICLQSLWRFFRSFLGFLCRLLYPFHYSRKLCYAFLSMLFQTAVIRQIFTILVDILLGVVDLSVVILFVGKQAFSMSQRFMIPCSWAAIPSLLFRKLLLRGVSIKEFITGTPRWEEEFSAGLKCRSTSCRRRSSRISAFFSYFSICSLRRSQKDAGF